jgi:ABC-2 type transport system ATP-binding protein
MSSAPSLTVRGMVKTYDKIRAVDAVSFDNYKGEIFGLLGPNGAGKTSLIECILGLREMNSGSVEIDGLDIRANARTVKQRIGAVLQSTALQDAITPREALTLFASFYPRALSAEVLLKRFGLTEFAGTRFETLSGGQRQRLALALAFVNDPSFIILDEPTAGLDPQIRRDLHDTIRALRADGRTVLLSTHYIEEAHALCDRIAIMHRGKIAAIGTPDELIARSASPTRIIIRTSKPVNLPALSSLPGIKEASQSDDTITLQTNNTGPLIIELVRHLEAEKNELLDLQVKKPSLEDLFIELTGGPE